MSRAQAESVIKNIIREIAQECASQRQVVSETLVAFMVKAAVLDPKNGFNVDRTLTKDDVQRLIKICISKLLDDECAALDTIKMQVYFDMNYTNRNDFLEEHRRVLESRLQPIVREITDNRARTKDELESLYRKIVSYILLRSGLGTPTDIAAVREATAALQSVFPQTELGTFMSLVKRDKERQLVELTLIVSGIRLFNKECGKGGEGIDDLPTILREAVPSTIDNVQTESDNISAAVYDYIGLLENVDKLLDINNTVSWEALKDVHINGRQHEHFVNILLHDIKTCRVQIDSLEAQYRGRMDILRETVASKTAVPTSQVYPQFINLAHIWTGFQDEMILLSVLSNIFASLEQFTKIRQVLFDYGMLEPLLQHVQIKSDDQRIEETSSEEHRINKSRITDKDIEVLFPDTTKNFDKLPIQFRGFCGWTIVTKDRLLIPANPDIGVFFYKDNYYAFSSAEAAYDFASRPEYFVSTVAERAKKSPELIQLLELHRHFAAITPYAKGKGPGGLMEAPVTKADFGTQTDTHINESNIVKTYEWNEWELRRKAIKLANLRTKITRSMQTDLSNYKRDNETQVYLPKEIETQTKRDGSSNVPKPSVFIAGLRGCDSTRTKMTKVDLTIDVDQT
eukprot:gene5318-5987_t